MDREIIQQLFESSINDVSGALNLKYSLAEAMEQETELRYKSDILNQIGEFIESHQDLDERADRIRDNCRNVSAGTVFHGTNTIYLGMNFEQNGSEQEFKDAFYSEDGHVLYNIAVRERKKEKPSLLSRFRRRDDISYSDTVSELCDGLVRYAMGRSYNPEDIEEFADFGSYWLNHQPEKFDKVKEEYKLSKNIEEDTIYLKHVESEFKRFGEPSTAIAAYFTRDLMKNYSPEEIASSISLALFDRRVSLSDCQSFVDGFERLCMENKKGSRRHQVSVETEKRQDYEFPRYVTLTSNITVQNVSHDEDPDVGFDAYLIGKAKFQRELPSLLSNEIRNAGGLDGLILGIRKVGDKTDLKFRTFKCTCTATRNLSHEVDAVYFG